MMNMNGGNIDGSIVSKNMAWNKIHVLLVEHESRDHENIMNMLHFLSYKVTSVKLASNALSILSKGNVEFDVALVNMNSPDLLGSQLLHDATKINLPLIFMTNVDDDLTSLMALEHGAYLCIKKPMTMAMLKCLWQFVLREKLDLRQKEVEASAELMGYNYKSRVREREYFENFVVESSSSTNQNHNNILNIHGLEENPKSSSSSSSSSSEQHNHEDDGGSGSGRFRRRKDWLEWTVELHEKFMAAAKQLGQGKCYPKDILEIMDVPGLSRMQVASHLQKCRSAKWLPPNERSSSKGGNNGETAPKRGKKAPRKKTLRFGLMPNFVADETTINYINNEDEDQKSCEDDFINHHLPAAAACSTAIHDGAADQTSNPRPRLELLLDEEGFIFNTTNNMGLDEHFINCGHNQDHQIFAPLTDIEDPNFELTTMDSSLMPHHGHGFSDDIRQDLLMDFNGTWPSSIPDDYHQVADATDDQWFREALNPPQDACGDGKN